MDPLVEGGWLNAESEGDLFEVILRVQSVDFFDLFETVPKEVAKQRLSLPSRRRTAQTYRRRALRQRPSFRGDSQYRTRFG